MKTPGPKLARLARSTKAKPLIPAQAFAKQAIHPQQVSRLVERGDLTRVGRGRYVIAASETSENFGLALVAAAAPRSVICLLSALRFHNIGTEAPREVWIAVERGDTRPRIDYPPVRVAQFAGPAFKFGIERHVIDGVPIRVYSAAKTLADCFRFRNKIGLDVALEALRESLPSGRFTRDELWAAAKVCRVSAVMRPYIEVFW